MWLGENTPGTGAEGGMRCPHGRYAGNAADGLAREHLFPCLTDSLERMGGRLGTDRQRRTSGKAGKPSQEWLSGRHESSVEGHGNGGVNGFPVRRA